MIGWLLTLTMYLLELNLLFVFCKSPEQAAFKEDLFSAALFIYDICKTSEAEIGKIYSCFQDTY